jgi:hypothetical protein
MSGDVLATENVEMGDADLSIGIFFNTAKMALRCAERKIQLVIGNQSFDNTAAKLEQKFFLLDEVQDMIGEHGEVKINVVVMP